jgi:murein DD-endopeptidase MepM/ murein hydrolase activator NlpD
VQKNNRFYTFLFTNSNKTKNNIRPYRVSEQILHVFLTALILTVSVASIGYAGFIKNTAFAKSDTNVSAEAAAITASQTVNSVQNNQKAEHKSISYDRPESDIDIIYDDGGPDSALRLSPAENEAQQNSMGTQVQMMAKTGNLAYLPTMWAHFGKINNEFGFRRNPFGGGASEFHPGMDIDGEKGDTIVAPANGTVIKAEWYGGYGNMIEIDHGNGLKTRYGHLSGFAVQAGMSVQRGQLIGLVGSTGRSTGAHLHFEIRLNDKPINPRLFLSSAPTEIAALNAR